MKFHKHAILSSGTRRPTRDSSGDNRGRPLQNDAARDADLTLRGLLLTAILFCFVFTLPVFAANVPNKRGRYRLTFDTRSRQSSAAELAARGIGKADPEEDYDFAQMSYEVMLPESYDPAVPIALFIWIHSGDEGGPLSQFAGPLMENGFVFIGANQSGNERSMLQRIGLAVDAAVNMPKLYNIDPDRIYVAGFSGGSRTASRAAIAYADIFTGGAIYVCGCDFYDPLPAGPGRSWPGFWGKKDHRMLEKAKTHSYVFLTGSKDFNQPGTIRTFNAYEKDGFGHCKYIEVPNQGHGPVPNNVFDEAFRFLNLPLLEKGKKAMSDGVRQMEMRRFPEAVALLRKANAYGVDEALVHLDKIKAAVAVETEKGQTYLREGDAARARVHFQKIIQVFGDDITGTAREELTKLENSPAVADERKAAERFLHIRNDYTAVGKAQAAASLNQLITDYPDTAAAEKARATLKNMGM